MLREFIGENNIGDSNSASMPLDIQEADSSALVAPSPDTLMVEVEGIHTLVTKNFTRYSPEALKESQKAWTSPYLKPVILHHNDTNGKIIGRIYNAEYTDNTRVQGSGGLVFTLSIPDEQAAKDVKNRILETVSIGVSAEHVTCSCCNSDVIDAIEGCPNGHVRGEYYDGKLCYWNILKIQPKEISYVIVPSDVNAINKRVYLAKEAGSQSFVNKTFNESADESITKLNNGENKSTMDLEKQLADAQEQIKNLQAELEKAQATGEELAALKAEKQELDKKLEEIKALLEEKNKEVEAEKEKLVISEEKLNEAQEKIAAVTQEKDAAVEAGLAAKEQLRAFACSTLNKYREISGKEALAEDVLTKRSIDSILDSVLDLSEDFKDDKKVEKEDPKKIDLQEFKVPNPVAPNNETPKKVEQNQDYKTVNLAEGLSKMFAEAAKLN